MTRDQAIELARQCAVRTADAPYHDYQPTPEQARNWMPHEWVIAAIMAATIPDTNININTAPNYGGGLSR